MNGERLRLALGDRVRIVWPGCEHDQLVGEVVGTDRRFFWIRCDGWERYRRTLVAPERLKPLDGAAAPLRVE